MLGGIASGTRESLMAKIVEGQIIRLARKGQRPTLGRVIEIRGGVVRFEEFFTGHSRDARIEELEIKPRTHTRKPGLTRWGAKERQHNRLLQENQPDMLPRRSRRRD